jgi:5'-nucleotidase/UDP-sugar diphosphatase
MLYLDAGDEFQGGLEASKVISSGEIISDYFNHMGNDGSAVGNHEFDFGPEFLDYYIDKLEQNILSANIIDTSKE